MRTLKFCGRLSAVALLTAVATIFASVVVAQEQGKKEVSAVKLRSMTCTNDAIGAKSPSGTKESKSEKERRSSVFCDYFHESTFRAAQLTLEVGGVKRQLDRKDIVRYPATGQRTVVLAIFDVSDPRRSETTRLFYPELVAALDGSRPSHVSMGIGTFSNALTIVRPFGSAVGSPRVSREVFSVFGASTELNRAALDAMKLLNAERADRRVLVIVSDGKAEDTAYRLEDVVDRAVSYKIPIVTVGVSERASDSPSLQSLMVLAEQTGGGFFDLSKKVVPSTLQADVLAFAEAGGRVRFDADDFHGTQSVKITVLDANKKKVELITSFDFSDSRDAFEKARDFAVDFWWVLVVGLLCLIILVLSLIKIRRDRVKRSSEHRVLAELRSLDSAELVFEVRGPVVTIGRADHNDIVLTNSSVSSRHAELQRTRDGGVKLVDLGSTNGTTVNGVRITTVNLRDGDLIEVAEVRLQYRSVN